MCSVCWLCSPCSLLGKVVILSAVFLFTVMLFLPQFTLYNDVSCVCVFLVFVFYVKTFLQQGLTPKSTQRKWLTIVLFGRIVVVSVFK